MVPSLLLTFVGVVPHVSLLLAHRPCCTADNTLESYQKGPTDDCAFLTDGTQLVRARLKRRPQAGNCIAEKIFASNVSYNGFGVIQTRVLGESTWLHQHIWRQDSWVNATSLA